MVCLFCLKETNDGVTLHGASELAQHARNMIAKHFWFDVNEINLAQTYACSDCWTKIESFHDFYVIVETNYRKKSNHNDVKMFGNPLLDCEPEPEPIVDEAVAVKVEIIPSESRVSDYETVFVPSTPYWNDSNIQMDNFPNELNSRLVDHSNAQPAVKEEFAFNGQVTALRNKRVLNVQNVESTLRTRKNASKSKIKVKKTEKDAKKKKVRINARFIEEIICYMCHKPLASFRGVRRHFHVHDPAESHIHECYLCGRRYSRINILKKHMKYHEAREKYDKRLDKGRIKTTCPICQKELTRRSLKSHILAVHENKKPTSHKTHMCEVCGKGYSAPSLLAHHAITHVDRETSKVQCDICGRWVKNQNILRTHKATHILVPKKCPHCDKIKMTRVALTKHIQFAHSEPKHPCTFCEKSFRRAKSLKEHIATHTGESLYSCLYCSRRFKSDANKYKHMREQHLPQWNLDRAKK